MWKNTPPELTADKKSNLHLTDGRDSGSSCDDMTDENTEYKKLYEHIKNQNITLVQKTSVTSIQESKKVVESNFFINVL